MLDRVPSDANPVKTKAPVSSGRPSQPAIAPPGPEATSGHGPTLCRRVGRAIIVPPPTARRQPMSRSPRIRPLLFERSPALEDLTALLPYLRSPSALDAAMRAVRDDIQAGRQQWPLRRQIKIPPGLPVPAVADWRHPAGFHVLPRVESVATDFELASRNPLLSLERCRRPTRRGEDGASTGGSGYRVIGSTSRMVRAARCAG